MYVLSLLRRVGIIFPVLFLYVRWRERRKEFGSLGEYMRKNPYLMVSEFLLAIGWLYLDLCYDKIAFCVKTPGWSKLVFLAGALGLSAKAIQGPGQRKKFTGVMMVFLAVAVFAPV